MNRISWAAQLLLFTIIAASSPVVATVPLELEPDYARAALAYQKGQYEQSLRLVRRMLTEAPEVLEVLELKALLLLEKKQKREAQALSLKLLRLGYKSAENHFLLGELAFEGGALPSARRHFEEVVRSSNPELALRAYYYLARISEELQDPTELVRSYVATRQLASELVLKKEVAPQTLELAKKALNLTERELRAFGQAGLYASLGLTAAYDSNVLASPTNAESAPLGQFRYSLAYPTSPLNEVQILPSYSGSANYVGNAKARSNQFLSQTVSVYVTRYPLALTNYGFQAEVSGSWQYRAVAGSTGSAYQSYGLFGSLGPYFKLEFAPKWVLGIDLFFQPRKYYVDSLFAASQARTGWEQLVSFSVLRSDFEPYWNPEVTLTLAWQQTTGKEFRSRRLGLDLSNTWHLSRRWLLTASFAVTLAVFPDLTSARYDQIPALGGILGFRVNPYLTLIGSARFSKSLSSAAASRNSRFTASLGASLLL